MVWSMNMADYGIMVQSTPDHGSVVSNGNDGQPWSYFDRGYITQAQAQTCNLTK